MIGKIKDIIRTSAIINNYDNSSESKPALPLFVDLMKWALVNRGHILSFFILGLNKKNRKLSEYLHTRSFKSSYRDFYPPSYLCILEDKLMFEKFINNYPEYAPKNIGYVTKIHLYFPDELPQPIENILKYDMNCIVKNTWGYGGKDIFLLKIISGGIFINGNQSTLSELKNKLPERAVLQEILEQHEVLKQFHPASINTARVVTVNTGTEVILVSTALRMGVGNNFVDNIAKGNMYVPINKHTGMLTNVAYSNKEPIFHLFHPETKVKFEGVKIPYFKEAIDICKKLHLHLPYFFILGWDVAFTPKGPIIIESNNIHKITIEQMWEGGLKKQFDGYIKDFKENKQKERRLNYA